MSQPRRYTVTELDGYSGFAAKLVGRSCHVLDRAWNYKIVATYRTENHTMVPGTRPGGAGMVASRAYVRLLAHQHADRLNAEQVAA